MWLSTNYRSEGEILMNKVEIICPGCKAVLFCGYAEEGYCVHIPVTDEIRKCPKCGYNQETFSFKIS